MVMIPHETRSLMHEGLRATSVAIESYASACRSMAAMSERGPLQDQLKSSIRRLDAMRSDIERRLRSDNSDVLFIALLVAQAGFSSLVDSIGEMRQIIAAVQPRGEPQPGWFIDGAPDAAAAS